MGLKLVVTLRHLSTGESCTLHCRTTRGLEGPPYVNLYQRSFQKEYLICPTEPENWKSIRSENVPNAVGALGGKHIAIKKPMNSGSEYFNYKGYFSLVLLYLVDAEYKFLWVNMGASGLSSDAQTFNHSKLKRRIKNGTLGLPLQESLGHGGQIYTTSCLGMMP